MLSSIKTNNNDILKEFGFTKTKTEFLSFEKCKEEVGERRFKNKGEYQKNRNSNWPSHPHKIYENQGWKDWYDFLGNDAKEEFLSFKECRKEVRKRKFKNTEEYRANRKPNWPSTPYATYKNSGWKDWYDFLGNGLLSFETCKEEVRKCKLKNQEEYQKNRKNNWPSRPDKIYKIQGWNGWYDFLGKNKAEFLSFKQCRKEVRECKFKSRKYYLNNRNSNWPSNPPKIYKIQGWNGWWDFLGNDAKEEFLSFKECRKEVRKRKFKNADEYRANRKPNWPSSPYATYKNSGWKDWYDFLGNGLLSFETCKEEVRKCKFKIIKDYLENRKHNWPGTPHVIYKNKGWKDWYDFLGKQSVDFLSFKQCRKEVRECKFKNQEEYLKNRKPNWPSNPKRTYKKQGWGGWDDFLGRKGFLSFEECRGAVRKQKFKNTEEYRANRKHNWPSSPDKTYKNSGWKDWYDFLGNGFLSFNECKRLVRECRFECVKEYLKNRKHNWPSNPDAAYKDQGWKDWYDFLGKTNVK